MASSRLPNHLQAHRKRLALTQEDVRYLLGLGKGAKVSRYERYSREPNIRTALAFEAIFQTSVKELFPGTFDEIEKVIVERAKQLLAMMGNTPTRREVHRYKCLLAIARMKHRDEE